MCLCWDLLLSYSLESLPLHFLSAKHSAPFVTLKNPCRGTQFAHQLDHRHAREYQGRDFQLSKVQSPTDQKENYYERFSIYLCMHTYICMCMSVSVHIISACVCVHAGMCTYVFMHIVYVYSICIHMHNCGCIFENTQL